MSGFLFFRKNCGIFTANFKCLKFNHFNIYAFVNI